MIGRSVRRRGRRWICAALVTVLVATGAQLVWGAAPGGAAAPPTLTATLGANPSYSGLESWVGDGTGTPKVVTDGGVSAWETQPASHLADYIYTKVTDSTFPHPHSATVTVTYWDGPSTGFFALQYDSTGNVWASSEQVSLTGTNTWLTHTFNLYDANFAGEENNGASFRVTTDSSPVGVAVAKIDVAQSDVPGPPAIQQVQPGNIFMPGQTPTLTFTTTSSGVKYQAYDYDNNLVASGSASGTSGTITITGLGTGYYTLRVTSDNNGTESPPVLNGFGVLPAPIPSARGLAGPFGTLVHVDQGQPSSFYDNLVNAGIYNTRGGVSYNWSTIETSKGVYDWSSLDPQMAAMQARGNAGNMGLNCGAVPSFYSGTIRTDAATLQACIDFTNAMYQRYPKVATSVEIANEPDINGWTPQDFFNILKPVYVAVKAALPNVSVYGPTGPGIGSWSQELIQLGALHYLDAWDIHPYPAVPEGVDTTVAQLEQWLEQQNSGKYVPIMATETGWNVSKDWNTPGTAATRTQQAQYDIRDAILLQKAGLRKIFWYEGADEWGTWGLLDGACCWLSASAPGGYGYSTPHPAFDAVATLTRELSDATYDRTLQVTPKTSPQPIQAYRFTRKAGGPIDVLWTTGAPTTVQLPAAGPVTVVDAMDDSVTLHPSHGYVSLSLTGDPVYVTGVAGVAVATGGPFHISAPPTAASADTVPVTLSVDRQAGTPATFVVAGTKYVVNPGSTKTANVTASAILGPQTVPADVLVDGQQVGRVAASFQVTQPLTITTDPKVLGVNPAQTEMDVTVRNNRATSPVTVNNLQWFLGSRTDTVSTSTTIAPNGSHTFTIALPSSVGFNTVYPLRVSLQYGSTGETQTTTGTLDFAPVVNKSLGTDWTTDQLQSQPSVVLPDQAQWQGGTQPTMSGNVWWDWDSSNLYMTAQIKQATFHEPNPIDTAWQHDSIQFAVSPDVPDGTATSGSIYTAFNVALTPDGPQVQRFESPLSTGVLTDASVRITRDDATQLTTYYLAIPWTDIASVDPAKTNFGLTWLTDVDQTDGSGRIGWLQWGSGFGNGRNPAQFNFAQLMAGG